MRSTSAFATIILLCVLVLVLALAGCGDSTPLPVDTSVSTYAPSTGAFAAIPASLPGNALAVNTCNLDAVNDKPVGSEPLSHGSMATFTGWAADATANTVPVGVQLMLKGAQDYAVNAATGMPRPDVAKSNNRPAWSTAGYSVKADLSAVAPGTYTPVLAFSVNGKPMLCATQHKLTIQ